MTSTLPPPPPSLRPPSLPKKRKNLTIKMSEFEAWVQIKGEMSWTAIMQFVRMEYLRLRNMRVVVQHKQHDVDIKRIKNHINPPMIRGSNSKISNDVINELRSFDRSKMVHVTQADKDAVIQARIDRVKNRKVIA